MKHSVAWVMVCVCSACACCVVYSKILPAQDRVPVSITSMLTSSSSHQHLRWKKISHGISEAEVTRIVSALDHPDAFMLSTFRAVYKSYGASSYPVSLVLEGRRPRVHEMIANPRNNSVLIVSNRGLYQSLDAGNSFDRIYTCEASSGEECRSVVAAGGRIFLGTTQGLLDFDPEAYRWKSWSGYFKDQTVSFLAQDAQHVYAAVGREVVRFQPGQRHTEKVFVLPGAKGEQEENFREEDLQEDPEGDLLEPIRDLRVFYVNDQPVILLLTIQGIFISDTQGDRWQRLFDVGIPLADACTAAICQGSLWVGTSKGAYQFVNHTWRSVTTAQAGQKFFQIFCHRDNRILAATDKGAFELLPDTEASIAADNHLLDIQRYFDSEPSIHKVHQMAIAYAEVHPDKIQQWRRQLVTRALLPKLSIGVDGDKNKTISNSIYGSYTGGGQSYVGPDDKTFYNNFGWGVSVSWDLGDLVWNSSQTSIDSRSKLMVELREDILNEVTRLYFERRRLFVQLSQVGGNVSAALDLQMRLDEVTALIDAYTAGGFSREIERGSKDDGA